MREAKNSDESKLIQDGMPKYIAYEKIMVQLRQKFLIIQEQVYLIIGYNFEFYTPFEHINKFKETYWQYHVKPMIFNKNNQQQIK